jgi:hypothetical protein
MLKNLFGSTKSILCPYCLAKINFRDGDKIDRCPSGMGKNGCGSELPAKYVMKFEEMQPCYTQLIGWSQVGKTVYLQALTAMLFNLGVVWKDDFAPSAQTEATLKYNRNVKKYMANGQMPPATQLQLQDAYIMQLEKMARWGSRTLVLRDVAGEHFNELQFPVLQTPYLIHVPTTLMLISIDDLQRQNVTMDELMNSYIQTLMKFDPRYGVTKRNVIVVLTKADLIVQQLNETLQTYLSEDPFVKVLVNPDDAEEMGDKEMEAYMKKLKAISDEIQKWVKGQQGGQTLIALARNEKIELRFTIVSSTGGAVGGDNQMRHAINPTRVLDPFFWALEFQSRP